MRVSQPSGSEDGSCKKILEAFVGLCGFRGSGFRGFRVSFKGSYKGVFGPLVGLGFRVLSRVLICLWFWG